MDESRQQIFRYIDFFIEFQNKYKSHGKYNYIFLYLNLFLKKNLLYIKIFFSDISKTLTRYQ